MVDTQTNYADTQINNVANTNSVANTMANTMNIFKNPSSEKVERFNGIDIKCWQQKMLFYLTTMNLENIVKEDVPKTNGDAPLKESLMTVETWKHSDFL